MSINNPITDLLPPHVWDKRENGFMLRLWAKPGAKQEASLGIKTDEKEQVWLHVSVKAAPEDGKANKALIAFLADWLGVKRSAITQISGGKSRQKLFLINHRW